MTGQMPWNPIPPVKPTDIRPAGVRVRGTPETASEGLARPNPAATRPSRHRARGGEILASKSRDAYPYSTAGEARGTLSRGQAQYRQTPAPFNRCSAAHVLRRGFLGLGRRFPSPNDHPKIRGYQRFEPRCLDAVPRGPAPLRRLRRDDAIPNHHACRVRTSLQYGPQHFDRFGACHPVSLPSTHGIWRDDSVEINAGATQPQGEIRRYADHPDVGRIARAAFRGGHRVLAVRRVHPTVRSQNHPVLPRSTVLGVRELLRKRPIRTGRFRPFKRHFAHLKGPFYHVDQRSAGSPENLRGVRSHANQGAVHQFPQTQRPAIRGTNHHRPLSVQPPSHFPAILSPLIHDVVDGTGKGVHIHFDWLRMIKGMDRVKFSIAYDGPAIRDGAMDVRDLAPALLAIGQVFDAANILLNGENPKIKVNVTATGQGSFEVYLEVLRDLTEKIVDIFNGDVATALLQLKEFVIIGGGATGGIIWLVKRLRGKSPDRLEKISESLVRVTIDGESYEIPLQLMRLYQDIQVRVALSQLIEEPLRREGIEIFEVREDCETRERVSRDEAKYFARPLLDEEVLIENTRSAAFSIISLAFKDDNKWRLSDGSAQISASIIDEDLS